MRGGEAYGRLVPRPEAQLRHQRAPAWSAGVGGDEDVGPPHQGRLRREGPTGHGPVGPKVSWLRGQDLNLRPSGYEGDFTQPADGRRPSCFQSLRVVRRTWESTEVHIGIRKSPLVWTRSGQSPRRDRSNRRSARLDRRQGVHRPRAPRRDGESARTRRVEAKYAPQRMDLCGEGSRMEATT